MCFIWTRTLCILIILINFKIILNQELNNNGSLSTDNNDNRLNKISMLNSQKTSKRSCNVTKGSHIYDLTSISQKKYSFYSESYHNDSELVFYISICHPVEDIIGCGPNDGVCFAYINTNQSHNNNEEVKFVSGGKINDTNFTPNFMQEGSLRYTYENGAMCKRGVSEIPYMTELHLQCPFNAEEETPNPILMTSPQCLFIFVWITLAACPKTIEVLNVSNPCIIKYADSSYSLNLHSLTATTFYKPNGIDFKFEINICGPINGGSCKEKNTLICDITNDKNPVALTEYNKKNLAFNWKDEALVMSHKNYDNSTSEIYFYCDRTFYIPRVYFLSHGQNSYKFSIYTVNVCTPEISDCVIEDKKMNVFDLRPLHKKAGNWEVIRKLNNSESFLYHINMCGPVNVNSYAKCPDGPIGACQTSISTSGSKNIGFITSHPIVNNDNSLTVLYTGGDSCKEGVKFSSTRINLICSHVNYQPIFVEVTESCEHLFEWYTPAACPLNVVTGKNCKVTDPRFGHSFDLTPLRNETSDYRASNGVNVFIINVCGPLISECEGKRGDSAVCEIKDQEKSLGVSPAELIFNDGTLIMKFSNGSAGCGEGTWASQILFLCSHSENNSEGPQYIHADESTCIHHFIWHTKYACPPHSSVNCSVTDGDLYYDLTPLSNPSINEIFISYDDTKKYVLNICRSIIHSKDSRCEYNAGACLIDLSHENKTKNLGVVKSNPYLVDNHLMIKYEDGDMCNATHKYETIIEFECSDEQYLSYPILEVEEQCKVFFSWSTIYACPQNLSLQSVPEEEMGNCTVINPQTKYLFDMNDLLTNKPYELNITKTSSFLISACGAINDSRCPHTNVGACVVDKSGNSRNAGKTNKNLQFHMWSTFLEYKDGDTCSNGRNRSTKISFICREKGFPSGPILIADDKDSCSFFVNWYTENACERHINCFADSWNHIFDLSPLVRVYGNYQVKDPKNDSITYILNICRPLNPIIGVNCHPGSSSCLIRRNEEPLSLGHPILNPTFIGPQEVHLMYAHGSQCLEDPDLTLSSRIIFICKREAGAGEPVFYRRTRDCQTQFKWFTSLVCPPLPTEGNCQIAFEAAKTNIDLTPLKRESPYRVQYHGRTFILNICGASVCNGSGVCTEEDGTSYGLSSQSKLVWQYSALLLSFYSGSLCPSSLTGSRTAEIYFDCDPKAGYGYPEASPIMQDTSCSAVFTWKTNLTCLETLYNNPSIGYNTKTPPVTSTPHFTTSNSSTLPNPSTLDVRIEEGSHHMWISVMIATIVLVSVVATLVFLFGRSHHGRRLYAHAKRTLFRKGYASAAENDTLLGGDAAFVYRVDEDERVLRV